MATASQAVAGPSASSLEDVGEEKKKVNRPTDSKFKQQKLPAWQPILTAGTVLPAFFIVGLIFIPIGIGLIVSSNRVNEFVLDYTDICKDASSGEACRDVAGNATRRNRTCSCTIAFNLTEDFLGDVFVYYGLSNFYQNHRRYVKSRDDAQLLGGTGPASADCLPFQKDKNISYVPCGAVANSMFNDSFALTKAGPTPVPLISNGTAWPSDIRSKFKNPDGGASAYKNEGFTKPPNWAKAIWEMENGLQNEDFVVWMRTAALPTFRKLHRRLDRSQEPWKDGLKAGSYAVSIQYNYPVDAFGGRKKFIISTVTWIGGRNPFLGIAYIVVGSLCVLLGVVFLLVHVKFGKS